MWPTREHYYSDKNGEIFVGFDVQGKKNQTLTFKNSDSMVETKRNYIMLIKILK